MAAELTPGGVELACHPSLVSGMRTNVLVEGHSISGTAAVLQETIATWQQSYHMQEQNSAINELKLKPQSDAWSSWKKEC